jgi:hypothetical protein
MKTSAPIGHCRRDELEEDRRGTEIHLNADRSLRAPKRAHASDGKPAVRARRQATYCVSERHTTPTYLVLGTGEAKHEDKRRGDPWRWGAIARPRACGA